MSCARTRRSVGPLRWTWPSTCSTACWTWDARTTSASPDPKRSWGHCARSPDPCNTAPIGGSARVGGPGRDQGRTRPALADDGAAGRAQGVGPARGLHRGFATAAAREVTDRDEVRRRLLLCLYGLGTNAGLKRLGVGRHGFSYKELLHTRRRYIDADALRDATRRVVNATLAARNPRVWGEGTTACASDSKHFGAFDQNLMTEWHTRYGGRAVMIYWHVERGSVCIHSRL